jgi:DNA polymerase I
LGEGRFPLVVDVPLAAFRSIVNDRQYLDVWTAKGMERVPAPFLPYCYTRAPRGSAALKTGPVEVRPLSNLVAATWHKHEFATVRGVSELSKDERPLEMADNHVAFVERVLIDEPDFFRKMPHGRAPRLMVLDVEQLSSGHGFPTENDPLIGIAWCCDDGPVESVLGDGHGDADILETFAQAVERCDPDVFVGYNVQGYDLDMIVKRMRKNGIDPARLGRGTRGPMDDDEGPTFEGRLIYDVYDSVKGDQTLFGIKDRRLKTVGEWMGYPIIKEDVSDLRSLVGTDRLRQYNVNDVELTRNLARIYWKNYVALAEFYGAPLNVVLRATANFHTTILQGRIFRRGSPPIVSDGTNSERYSALYDEAGGQAFVGGIVEIYRKGLFEPLYKVDFSSMYPSIMVSLGCGADNTRFVGEEPIGRFHVTVDGDRRVYSIPDESRNKNLLVEIVGVSPMALELKNLLKMRMELKKLAKATKDPGERDRLNARQHVIKIVLNSVYGVMAAPFARYGALPVAVAIVGVARQLIRKVEDVLGDAKIETDTDGVYSGAEPDLERVNDVVARYVEDELGGENFMRLEMDRYKAGFFHEQKSYLLLHEDGRIEKHGIAFKGSSHCGVFDKSLERVSEALLMGKGDPRTVGRACFDMDSYAKPDDFVLRVRVTKKLEDYAAPNAVSAQLQRQYQERFGIQPRKGEQLEYLKTSRGYELVSPEALARLDYDYYRGIVENVLDRLTIDWRPTRQVKLFDF